jgi:ribosomal protein L11 methyltransferase
MDTDQKNNGGKLNLLVAVDRASDVADWVREALQKEPVEIENHLAEEVLLEVYFDSLLEAQLAAKSLPEALPVQSCDASEYQAQDWTTFWHHHFKITDIGQRLRIVPEWEKAPSDHKINIIINPGLSFGTGGHFTTRFCLEAVESAFDELKPETMIDAGTGSGILAITAARLGIPNISAFDYDEVCVSQCEENALRNGVEGKIDFFFHDVLERGWFKEPVDLVCANILTSVLIEAAPLIIRSCKKRLILSGIREVEADGVADTFVQFGCRELSRDGDGQWCGLVLSV